MVVDNGNVYIHVYITTAMDHINTFFLCIFYTGLCDKYFFVMDCNA